MIAAPDMKNVETSNRSYEAMSYPFTEEVAPLPIPREELPCSHQESLACMASICHHMGQPATVMLVASCGAVAKLPISAVFATSAAVGSGPVWFSSVGAVLNALQRSRSAFGL